MEEENKKLVENIKKTIGVTDSDTGLALPSQWNLAEDLQLLQEHPMLVSECTKITDLKTSKPKYFIHIKNIGNYVVSLDKDVAPTDIEEGSRVGIERNNYQIKIPLPQRIDSSVAAMEIEEKPDVTYNDIGGCKEQL